MTIDVSKEEFEFLKDLQHELLTQTNDGNADPVYWGVMETREVPVPDGFGGDVKFMFGGCERDYSKEEFIEYIQEQVIAGDPELQEEWENVDTYFDEEIVDFYNKHSDSGDAYTVESREQDYLSRDTGCFLTKRACKEYIARFGYNHRNPHTYAMTAYRNNEYWRLLQILKTMKFVEETLTDEEITAKAKEYASKNKVNFSEDKNFEVYDENEQQWAYEAGAHSRDPEIRYLKQHIEDAHKKCDHFDEALQKAYEELNRRRWVKVEDRLPEYNKEIVYCTKEGYKYQGFYREDMLGRGYWESKFTEDHPKDSITKWMYLED